MPSALQLIKMLFLLLAINLVVVNCGLQNELVIKTKEGLVRGFKKNNTNHYAFYGIPYAKIPLGKDRFKAPLPPAAWSGVLNATTNNLVCPQRVRPNEFLIYHENCLKLDVFVPHDRPGVGTRLPVLVHIHGGGFIHSGDRGGPENLVRHGVIVVTFEYRVGVLGFLCLGTPEVPGNAGIKDQLAAFRWVRDNIANFGGDPKNVTAYGTSAGAISLDTIILANKSNGLFQRAIVESASAFCREYDQDSKQQAYNVARNMAYSGRLNVSELYNFFKTSSVKRLGTAPMVDFNPKDRVGPCIEKIISNTSIINEHPITLAKKGNFSKIPYMIGFASLEGLSYVPYFANAKEQLNNLTNMVQTFSKVLNKRERKKLQEKIKKAYFGKEQIRLDERYIQFCTELFAQYPILVSALLNAKLGAPVYLFKFLYDGNMGLPRKDFKYLVGARHSDFWAYVFTHGVKANTTDDQQTVNRLTTLITNFVKHGKPIVKISKLLPVTWKPISGKKAEYLEIGSDLTIRSDMLTPRLALLDRLYGYQTVSSSTPSSWVSLQNSMLAGVMLVVCAALY